MRKAILYISLITVLVVVVAVLGQHWFIRPAKEPAPATLGELSSREGQQVTARGTLVPVRWERLSLSATGKLLTLTVKVGDVVSPAQVLASLDTEELELGVALAQAELEAQEASLAKLQQGASSSEVAAAQAAYDAAVAAYEKQQAGPSPEEIIIAKADLQKAEEALHRAQGAYDRVRSMPDIGARYESVQLQSATVDYERAKAVYALAVAKPDKASLRQAESQVAAAKARLDAQPSDVRTTQASVARARVDLARAELALERATLHASFVGTVTTVNARTGDMLSPGVAVLTVADLSQLQVETEDLDEWGAASVKPNQSVDLLVPSLDNRSLRGRLVSVAMEPTVSASGAVFYKSVITLEQQDPDLRWGMTVRVRFAKLTGGLQ